MKNSHTLEELVSEKYRGIVAFDKLEIDNPDKYAPSRLSYLDRICKVVSVIKVFFPETAGVTIGEFGCAQANMSLLLAECGYSVYAIDVNPTFLKYSKRKWQKGDVKWILGNIDNPILLELSLDVAILGEVVEHCAYPEEIVEKVFRFVRPGGILILTTPNGARIHTQLPTFKQVSSKALRRRFEEKQFGPDGRHHLFLFKLEELYSIIPPNAKIVMSGYLGGTILINRYSETVLRLMPVKIIERSIRLLSAVPLINRKTFNNIFMILIKNSDIHT
jgi:2-polyprenyl-3-methyl-5-hydroxy-6-metoxy-1,4-benzoquinol methylase